MAEKDQTVESVTDATLAVVGAVLTAADPTHALAYAAAPPFVRPALLQLLEQARSRWDAFRFGRRRAKAQNSAPTSEAPVDELPLSAEFVAEAARLIAEALADEVVPVMGRMVHLYESKGRAADGFFRGVRRVLTDVTSEEFHGLYEIMQFTAAVLAEPFSADLIELRASEPLADGRPPGIELHFLASKDPQQHVRTLAAAPQCTSRIFRLLRGHMLGNPGNDRIGPQLPTSLVLERETVGRLWALLE
ncbi:MAG TPA: hypothetical protein VGG39_13070 [Polyangiaceae bacterium]|jgi:hypothetical protein